MKKNIEILQYVIKYKVNRNMNSLAAWKVPVSLWCNYSIGTSEIRNQLPDLKQS